MNILQDIICLSGKVRKEKPLIHNITNYVTVNDCANAILATGGSPIMADDIKEAGEIVKISNALVLNMGTLNERTVKSMIAGGKQANELGIPVILDPVGAGASAFRNDTVRNILNEIRISVIRGNLSELSFVAGMKAVTKGVDASQEIQNDPVEVARKAAEQFHVTAAITGAVDVISDGKRTVKIYNGTEKMSHVTGTGCMTTAILGALHGATKDSYLAAVAAILTMGIAGEVAWKKSGSQGLGSFHIGIIDALGKMNEIQIREMARIEEI